MARLITTPGRPIRVALVSALLLTLFSVASFPAAAAHRPARTAGTAPRAVALPAGLAPVLARALWHGTDAPTVTWSQQAALTATDSTPHDQFGYSVAVSDNTALIGAPHKNGQTGAAFVFVRSGTTWSQQAKLSASDGARRSFFGFSVALSGNTALIGADDKNNYTGAAYVFVRSGTTWSQQAEIIDPCPCANYDRFGVSVALGGSTALVGAMGKNSTGAAYVFVRSGTTWSQQAEITATDGTVNDEFGYSVAVSGNTALIGAHRKNGSSGAAYVFVRSGTTWTQQTELNATDGMSPVSPDNFGNSVALSGNTALVGAHDKTVGKHIYAGAAYVFVRSGTTWSQQAEITATDGAANDDFGNSVALSGNTALSGAPLKNGYTGAAYVFMRSGTTWSQQAEITATDSAASDRFGWSVALGGTTALSGAYSKNSGTGAAYVFVRG